MRTLGASGRQIQTILAIEYALLGLVAGLIGVILALIASGALGIWVFKVDFYIPWLQVITAIATVVALSTATGLFCSRGICSAPPLQVLRGN